MPRRAFAIFATCGVLCVSPQVAAADHVGCGDVLVQDTRLDSDLQCSFPEEGTALTIAASDVTLDLGGHTVAGPTFYNEAIGIGSAGVDNLVIRNGTVRGFDADLLIQETAGTNVQGIRDAVIFVSGSGNTVRGNTDVAIAVRGNDNLVAGNEVTQAHDASDARWLSVGGDDNVIAHNVVTGVRPTAEDLAAQGISIRMHRGLVSHNVITAEPNWQSYGDSARGMSVDGDGTVIRKNVASGFEDGFSIWAPVTLVDNLAFANLDDGIEVGVSGATLTRNEANDNGDLGIEAVPATIDGGGNRAAGNGNPAQCVGVTCR